MPSTTIDILVTEQEQIEEHSSASDTSTAQPNAENLVAMFVARFDVHRGNVIEWQYPAGSVFLNEKKRMNVKVVIMIKWSSPDADLDGVEYQAICSGLHSISQDTMYVLSRPSIPASFHLE
jgi:hypothetical protein